MLAKNKVLLPMVLGAASLALVGCMSTNPYTGEQRVSNTSIGVGVGALGGALVGQALGHNTTGTLIGAGLGAATGLAVGHYMDQENEELRQRLVGSGVQVTKNGNYIQLNMASDVTFRTDSADISSTFYNTLNSVAVVLKKYHHNSIVVRGYTDSTGTRAHNQELSQRRAQSVANYLMAQGLGGNRIMSQGFGQNDPIATNSTTTGRAMNRRVTITLS